MTPEPKKVNKIISIYARTSTSRQAEDGTIETQLLAVHEFAAKNGYTIVREYMDDGWSGDSLIRPDLDQLRLDAKKKIWEAVLMYDPDRLARRYSYQELVMDELKEAGVEVIFVTTPAPKNSEERVMHGFKGLFTEWERAKIAERFRLGKLRKIKEGHIMVSESLYGYRYIPRQGNIHGYYEINESEASVMRLIFDWVDKEGLTLRGIMHRLHEQGIKPRKSKRGVWSTSTLSSQLKNRAYIGEAHWYSSYPVLPENPLKHEKYKKIRKSSRKRKPVEEWASVPVPAIIDKGVFDRVRTRLTANFDLCVRNTKNEYLLAKKIRCSCGSTRTGEGPLRGKHLYYRCSQRVGSYPLPPTCTEAGINARIADALTWTCIANLLSSPSAMQEVLNDWIAEESGRVKNVEVNIEALERELAKIKGQEARLVKAYNEGAFTVAELREYMDPYKEHIQVLQGQITAAKSAKRAENAKGVPTPENIKSFADKVAPLLQGLNFDEKRTIVRTVTENVVGTPEELKICGRIPLNLENYVELFTEDRNCWVAKCGKVHAF